MVLPPREALRIVPHLRSRRSKRSAPACRPVADAIIACLVRNQAALSPLCKNALAMAQSR